MSSSAWALRYELLDALHALVCFPICTVLSCQTILRLRLREPADVTASRGNKIRAMRPVTGARRLGWKSTNFEHCKSVSTLIGICLSRVQCRTFKMFERSNVQMLKCSNAQTLSRQQGEPPLCFTIWLFVISFHCRSRRLLIENNSLRIGESWPRDWKSQLEPAFSLLNFKRFLKLEMILFFENISLFQKRSIFKRPRTQQYSLRSAMHASDVHENDEQLTIDSYW